ncbi:MAG: hypothetical protein PHF00_06105 [Elusimicrobia bacterium]|nr:hypothetical protein [Elusimicrobiota bacterium]
MRLISLASPCLLLAAAAAQSPAALSEDRLQSLEERLTKLEGAPAKTSLSAFNPALGLALDFVLRDRDGKANFLFRSAEVNLEAPVDPFLKGWAIVNGSADGVEVEEAALETTALPGNLTVTGGRLFADFGRFPHFHDHELPVIDRPRSIDSFVGGESRADGVELSYLFPTEAYLRAVLGAYDKLGSENDRVDIAEGRPFDEFTYLGRLSAYQDIGADHSVELGASCAWTPKRGVVEDAAVTGNAFAESTRKNTWRTLGGLDLTYRYQPAAGGLYRGAVWGTEVLANNERRFGPTTRLPTDRVRAFSGYSYLWLKLGRRWRPGALADLAEDLDAARAITRTYTAFLTCDVTEFQRLRLAYSRETGNAGRPEADIVGLQWTGILGHHVHGFRDR